MKYTNSTTSFVSPLGKTSFRLSAMLAVAVGASSSQACSVCIAHAIGAGLQALGAQSLHKNSTTIGVSYLSFSKKNAGEDPGTSEKHDQSEVTLEVNHGLSDNWMIHASLPYVTKSLKATGEEKENSQGLGDITVGATYQIPPKPDDKILCAIRFDVKLPTGANNLKDGGVLKEQHNQLGTGSTDWSVGVLATHEARGGLVFGGLSARFNGSNDRHFRYGNVFFYNLGYSMTTTPTSSVVFEINGRVAGKDRTEDGSLDENSGGHFGYVSLSYRQNLGDNMGLVVGYQLPVLKNLNGSQSETGLFTIGVSRRM